LWLNLGDSYAGSGCGWQKEGGSSIKREWVDDYNGRPPGYISSRQETGLKPKDLMGIPWRVAFALQNDGWYFRSAIPWIKRNCMPESTTDRPTSAIEYVFLMAKSAKYFYDGEAVRVPATTHEDRPMGCQRSRSYNGKLNVDENAPKQFKHKNLMPDGQTPQGMHLKRVNKQDQTGNPTYNGFNERYNAKKHTKEEAAFGPARDGFGRAGDRGEDGTTRNLRNSDPFFDSWQGLYSESENPLAFVINPQSRPELHFATFPDLLAETCIKAGTSEYGCCPKCGAPYQRIVEASGGVIGQSWHPHAYDEVTGQVGSKDDGSYKRVFKGWKAGCKCDAGDPVPCVVLDPFMGSGTVAVVARDLNRSSVGCELNPEYVKIIRKRLQADSQLDSGVVSYKFEKIKA
jgi:hypothetical protein